MECILFFFKQSNRNHKPLWTAVSPRWGKDPECIPYKLCQHGLAVCTSTPVSISDINALKEVSVSGVVLSGTGVVFHQQWKKT